MIWDVRLAKAAAKQLEKLPRDYQTLLLKKLNEMKDHPFVNVWDATALFLPLTTTIA